MKTKLISKISREEKGAGLVEYALLVALVALMGVASVERFGLGVCRKFVDISNATSTDDSIGSTVGYEVCGRDLNAIIQKTNISE